MTGTSEPSPQLVERIHREVAKAWPGAEVSSVAVLPGGHSGLTYRVATDHGDLVVKAVPEGVKPIGRHDMLRQAEILTALGPTDVPTPEVVVMDRGEPAWFAMTLVPGQSLEPTLDDPAVDPELAAARMRRAAEIMPVLHAVPTGLLPGEQQALGPADELARWAKTMGAVPPDYVDGAQDFHWALSSSVPAGIEPTLVHGDYRLGNMLCDGTEPRALIDWEIWSVGDPRVEIGWFLVFADGTNFPGVGRDVPGLPSAAELTELCSGGTVPEAQTWFNALGRYKMAAIMGHNLRRHREGRHHDPAQEQLPATIKRLITTGRALLD
ncbi:phosphotransferase family protein [Citricoccus nitrophenolicus]